VPRVCVPYPYALRISSVATHLVTVLNKNRDHDETDAMLSDYRVVDEEDWLRYALLPYAHSAVRGTVNDDCCWPAWRSM